MRKIYFFAAVIMLAMGSCKESGKAEQVLPASAECEPTEQADATPAADSVNADDSLGGHLEAESTTSDAGTFAKSEALRDFTFTLRNTGDKPMRIYNVEVSCGCMGPEFEDKEIQPGEQAVLTVHYDGRDKVDGEFEKGLTVVSSADNSRVGLTIKGNMLP